MKQPKPFSPHKNRVIRMSEKTWQSLKKKKLKVGKNWDKFLLEVEYRKI